MPLLGCVVGLIKSRTLFSKSSVLGKRLAEYNHLPLSSINTEPRVLLLRRASIGSASDLDITHWIIRALLRVSVSSSKQNKWFCVDANHVRCFEVAKNCNSLSTLFASAIP